MLISSQFNNARYCKQQLLRTLLLCCVLLLNKPPQAFADNNISLPALGDSGAALMSAKHERALGQAWLRSFRGSVPLEDDPLLFEYIENLLFELASNSELENRQLNLALVKNSTINAFAVPGGVIGIHTGLIENAKTEAQLASVLTHELAHLSQHHFARSIEAAKRSNTATIAGLLAGIILVAAGESNAGTAAIASSQAAALDTRLRYSRLHEREADRIGMKTLINAGYDANEAANMFKQMQNAMRFFGSKTPEFLLTHPVTESRIADAQSRAQQSKRQGIIDNIDFQLMKARVFVQNQTTPNASIKHFKLMLQNLPSQTQQQSASILSTNTEHDFSPDAARYGLALAYKKNHQWKKARKTLAALLQQTPGRIIYSLLDIEINLHTKNKKIAEKRLRDLYALTPNNYAVSMLLSKTLIDKKDYKTAEKILSALTKTRIQQTDVWYLLAEVQGLANNILGLHQSRAEFFMLRGQYSKSIQHLNLALKIAGDNYQATARIKQRLKAIANMHHFAKNAV